MEVPRQPDVNIGMVGHVDHGKTTLTKALSGEWTDRHSEEVKRGISIKLGYADTSFYRCPEGEPPANYMNTLRCPIHDRENELERVVSFVDAPGHETLMAVMISGAALMDGAALLIAANEPCPQPQTREHLTALKIAGVDKIVIVQNKIDVVDLKRAEESYIEIKKFIKGTHLEEAPIIPVSAHHNRNLDVLIQALFETIPPREYHLDRPFSMAVARSFDINKPGMDLATLNGGVLGGSPSQGQLEAGSEVEIKPGLEIGPNKYEPINTTAVSLFAGGCDREQVRSGGLVALGTLLDPSLTKSNALVGNLVGPPDTLPPVWNEFTLETHLLDQVEGLRETTDVGALKFKEPLMLTVDTCTTVGRVGQVRDETAEMALSRPVCAEPGQRVALSRRVGGRWHLIGYGTLQE